MDTPTTEENQSLSAGNVIPEPQTQEITAAIQALLSGGTIANAEDRRHIAEALAFLDSPTHNLPDLARHAKNIGELMAYGLTDPSVDALNRHLQMLLCQRHIADAEEGFAQSPSDLPAVRQSVKWALDVSSTFAKGYDDDAFLKQARALQARLE